MPYPVHGHGRSTKSRRGLAGLGSGERRSLPRPMAAIVAPKPLPFLTFLTTRLPARRSTQTSCSSSAGRRGPAVAATPRPACRVHSRFRSLLPPSAAASPPTAAVGEGIRRVRICALLRSWLDNVKIVCLWFLKACPIRSWGWCSSSLPTRSWWRSRRSSTAPGLSASWFFSCCFSYLTLLWVHQMVCIIW